MVTFGGFSQTTLSLDFPLTSLKVRSKITHFLNGVYHFQKEHRFEGGFELAKLCLSEPQQSSVMDPNRCMGKIHLIARLSKSKR